MTYFDRTLIEQDIRHERLAQDVKWGEQHHPDGTASQYEYAAAKARAECQAAVERGDVTWRHILAEEIAEAFAETDPEPLRAELVQCAAVIVAWMEDIDGRDPVSDVHAPSCSV